MSRQLCGFGDLYEEESRFLLTITHCTLHIVADAFREVLASEFRFRRWGNGAAHGSFSAFRSATRKHFGIGRSKSPRGDTGLCFRKAAWRRGADLGLLISPVQGRDVEQL